ncbi:MAG TPA: bifunctional 5,10-methylenetetrahydrofolate dehydrogenase/5,10-methenyltetrahydrofolate cyclohydrolase [Chloroflexota bacterium]|nr:bifunctional 5,10-methylenetetrahydrofolate dehydrogenase/5,10-methenyltetrahydrofolate cyclohydrolase [Chloroflexota bacterium]
MTSRLLDGRAAAEAVRGEVTQAIAARVAAGLPAPGLATVLAGDDPASAWYVGSIGRQAKRAGIAWRDVRVDPRAGDPALRAALHELNADDAVHGVIVMLPLPEPLTSATVAEQLDPEKDVDGITSTSMGRLALGVDGLTPCTPAGGMELLKRNGVPLMGAEAVVVGRSAIVGKPLALMLLAEHATVTLCHTRTRDLAAVCRRADVLCAAVGKPGLITAQMVKPGATVVDFGTTPGEGDKLVGDVDPGVAEVAGILAAIPGGTEQVTTAILLRNTLRAAERLGR